MMNFDFTTMDFNGKFFACWARTNIKEEPGIVRSSAPEGVWLVIPFSLKEAVCEYTAWRVQSRAITEFSFHEKPREVSFLNGEPFDSVCHPLGFLGFLFLVKVTHLAPLDTLGGIG
jgi:hypothetical protein